MGIVDFISSISDSIRRNACSSYEQSRAAVTKIHNVSIDKAVIEKLSHYLPDEDTRSKIAKNLAKNFAAFAVQEILQFVPGGTRVYNIVYQSLSSDKKSKDHREDLQELKDKVGRIEKGLQELKDKVGRMEKERNKVGRMEKELSDYRKLLEQTEIQKPVSELDCKNTLGLNQKPEDMIRVFMMTDFVGKHLLDNLIVPGVRSRKPHSMTNEMVSK